MRISDILRACADFMEETLPSLPSLPSPEGRYGRTNQERPSRYICDNLHLEENSSRRPEVYAPSATEEDCKRAKDFLWDLGMGRGSNEFPSDRYGDPTDESQMQRVCWLHFAADLWDEFEAERLANEVLNAKEQPQMSIETWTQEFYPHKANSAEAHERAIDHSLQKWIGLRRENLEKHGLIQVGYRLYNVEDAARLRPLLQIDAASCALCSVYHDALADFVGPEDSDEWEPLPECRECPLSKVRGGVPCDHIRNSETNSPYYLGTRPGSPDPEPMILWLLKAKEVHDA